MSWMKRFFKESLSPTMAVAILSLVIATGGTGFAAARFAQDTAPSAQRAGAAAQPVLGSGKTMIGYFTAGGSDGTSGYIGEGITFPAKLPGPSTTTTSGTSRAGIRTPAGAPGPTGPSGAGCASTRGRAQA